MRIGFPPCASFAVIYPGNKCNMPWPHVCGFGNFWVILKPKANIRRRRFLSIFLRAHFGSHFQRDTIKVVVCRYNCQLFVISKQAVENMYVLLYELGCPAFCHCLIMITPCPSEYREHEMSLGIQVFLELESVTSHSPLLLCFTAYLIPLLVSNSISYKQAELEMLINLITVFCDNDKQADIPLHIFSHPAWVSWQLATQSHYIAEIATLV